MDDYSFISLDKLESIIEELRDNEVKEVPMEYIISAFFPDAYDNIKKVVTQSYMDGYKAGLKSLLEDDRK